MFGEGAKSFTEKQKKPINGTNGDVEMNGGASDESDSDEDENVSVGSTSKNSTSIVALCVSQDGKWLATADLERRVEVYDLSSRKVRAAPPVSLAHSLLILKSPSLTAPPHSPYTTLRPDCSRFRPYLFLLDSRTHSPPHGLKQYTAPLRTHLTSLPPLVPTPLFIEIQHSHRHSRTFIRRHIRAKFLEQRNRRFSMGCELGRKD